MQAVKVYRAEAGITGIELAKRSGVPRETISKIEHGRQEPSAATLKKLADALDVKVADFYEMESRINPKAEAGSAREWLERRSGTSYLARTEAEWKYLLSELGGRDRAVEIIEAMRAEERHIAQAIESGEEISPDVVEGKRRFSERVIDALVETGKQSLTSEQRRRVEAALRNTAG